MGAYVLVPIAQDTHGAYWFSGETAIELPAKRPKELHLGYPFPREAFQGEGKEWEEFSLDVTFDDGNRIYSKPFQRRINLRHGMQG
jgi:hypothetical protein